MKKDNENGSQQLTSKARYKTESINLEVPKNYSNTLQSFSGQNISKIKSKPTQLSPNANKKVIDPEFVSLIGTVSVDASRYN